MTISQLPVELIDGGHFTLYDCMTLACVDKSHMQLIKTSRFYPTISDKVFQEVWRKFIDKKNEYEKTNADLKRNGELLEEYMRKNFSFRSVFIACLPSSITSRLQRFFPSVKKDLEFAETAKREMAASQELVLHSMVCKNEIPALKKEFCTAREDLLVMALFGGRDEYEKLPQLFDDIGVFEAPFKVFSEKYVKPVREIFERHIPSDTSFFNNDKALFLSVVHMKIDEQRNQTSLEELDPHIAPFFREFPDLVATAQEKWLSLGNVGQTIGDDGPEFLAFCLETAPTPIVRMSKINDRLSDTFAIRVKGCAEVRMLCGYRVKEGGWYLDDDAKSLFSDVEDIKKLPRIVTDKGELTREYEFLSEFLVKKRFTTHEGITVTIG